MSKYVTSKYLVDNNNNSIVKTNKMTAYSFKAGSVIPATTRKKYTL